MALWALAQISVGAASLMWPAADYRTAINDLAIAHSTRCNLAVLSQAKLLTPNEASMGPRLALSITGLYPMIHISTKNEPGRTTITVDGLLAGEDVDAVERSCTEAKTQERQVRLFLREVSNIDTRGLALLHCLARNGVELSAAGVYSSYIVEEVRRRGASQREPHRVLSQDLRKGT